MMIDLFYSLCAFRGNHGQNMLSKKGIIGMALFKLFKALDFPLHALLIAMLETFLGKTYF